MAAQGRLLRLTLVLPHSENKTDVSTSARACCFPTPELWDRRVHVKTGGFAAVLPPLVQQRQQPQSAARGAEVPAKVGALPALGAQSELQLSIHAAPFQQESRS